MYVFLRLVAMDDVKKDSKKRKELSGKLGKEMSDRRDECVLFPPILLLVY